ncbi:MAG: kinase [Euryarchaeota archaeon]|nr:kinase [Euryarchaeota archaeon]
MSRFSGVVGEKGTNLVIAITGSPGVGKTSVCTNLSDLGFRVTSVLDLAKAYSCLGPLETEFDSKSVDIDKLSEVAILDEFDFIDGHLSHHLDVDAIVILRCSPSLLKERLSQRGYSNQKVIANTEWEYIAGICSELIGSEKPILEVDATKSNTEDLVLKISEFIETLDISNSKYEKIEIDWMKEPPNFG